MNVFDPALVVQILQTTLQSYVIGYSKGYNTAVKNMQGIINPPNIVTFTDSGFDINMNNMDVNVPCIVTFDGSTYAMWKDVSKALIMMEIG